MSKMHHFKQGMQYRPFQDYILPGDLARSSFNVKRSFVFPSPPTGQKVRLRGSGAPYKGYLEMFRTGSWGLVCDSGSWTMKEAEMVCKQLGFRR
jgi:hypothetical protein